MSGEIKVNASLEVTNGNFKLPKLGASPQSIDQAVAGGGNPGMIVAVTAAGGTDIPSTGLTNVGWTFIRNMDLTNNVEYGPYVAATLHSFGLLKPGEAAVLRIKPGVAWHVIALVASCRVQVVQVEA